MDACEALSHLIEKLLLHRGRRDISCHVYPPKASIRTYSVVLEGNNVREQFILDTTRVEQYATTNNEQYVLTDVQAGLKHLERLEQKRKSARRS